jgi:hypothetical protein
VSKYGLQRNMIRGSLYHVGVETVTPTKSLTRGLTPTLKVLSDSGLTPRGGEGGDKSGGDPRGSYSLGGGAGVPLLYFFILKRTVSHPLTPKRG